MVGRMKVTVKWGYIGMPKVDDDLLSSHFLPPRIVQTDAWATSVIPLLVGPQDGQSKRVQIRPTRLKRMCWLHCLIGRSAE
jgi:hypothetical protein